MHILWFTWKDIKHPDAGGAEVLTNAITKQLVKNGHNVTIVTSLFKGCKSKEIISGVQIIRVGGKLSVYWKAFLYYKKFLDNKNFDVIIDEINTIPFFASFYAVKRSVNNYLFVHQLCRKIWFVQIKFPINIIGYILEPIYLRLLCKNKVITVSKSTKKDLLRYGFYKKNIYIISEGIDIKPIANLKNAYKYNKPTLLSFGEIREMKQTHHHIEAFELAKKDIPNLQLKIVGKSDSKYGQKVMRIIESSKYKSDIEYFGYVTNSQKKNIMQQSHILLGTSIKEGWGLTITEANSQGTLAIVYNVDGLRDSVRHNETGIICDNNTPENLANNIVMLLQDKDKYDKLRQNAWIWSKKITFEKSYNDFCEVLSIN